MHRLRTSLALAVLSTGLFILAASPAMAQSDSPNLKEIKNSSSPENTTCNRQFNFGSGADQFNFCITLHGNILHLFSPSNLRQINDTEGYVVCANGSPVAYDAGARGESGWGDPVILSPPGSLPFVIRRTSSDSRIQLEQSFNLDNEKKEIIISMKVTSTSSAGLSNVRVARYFDADLDSTQSVTDNADDIYDRDSDSVWGRDSGTGVGHHGVMLTALTFGTPHNPVVETFTNFTNHVNTCTATQAAIPTATGDFTGRVQYNLGTVVNTKTVKFIYRRF